MKIFHSRKGKKILSWNNQEKESKNQNTQKPQETLSGRCAVNCTNHYFFRSSLMSQGASESRPFLVQQCTEPSHLVLADHDLDGQLPTPSLLGAEHLIPHHG